MLPQKIRLQPKKNVGMVARHGNASNGVFFLLKTIKNRGTENRYSVVVSAKVSKSAQARNLLKRRAREIIRVFSKEMQAGGTDAVFIFKKPALSLSFRNLRSEMHKYISKLSS